MMVCNCNETGIVDDKPKSRKRTNKHSVKGKEKTKNKTSFNVVLSVIENPYRFRNT